VWGVAGFVVVLAAWVGAWAAYDPEMVTGFRNGFWPWPAYLAYNGGYFALGVVLWGARERLTRRFAVWGVMALGAQGLFGLWLWARAVEPEGAWPTVVASLFGLANALAMSGWALKSRVEAGAAFGPLRTLVRSAYFTYLTHMPVVGLAQVALWGVPIPSLVKMAIVAVVGLGVPLLLHRWVQGVSAGRARIESYSSPAS
jgi:hypothetical protein